MAGSDFVVCGICGLRGYSLKSHVGKAHGLTKVQYEAEHGSVVCSATRERYRDSGNYDWISRAKDAGQDLREWRQKLSARISAGVMASESAREARRQNLARLNQTEDFRARSSKTATLTSARTEIQQARSLRLASWRKRHPDIFMTRCFQRMLSVKSSRPEKILYQEVSRMFPGCFKHNQLIVRRGKFESTKSNIRQIDIYSKEHKIVIEFDGPFHFIPVQGAEYLEHVRKKDRELNDVMVAEGALVIRVSYDQFRKGKISDLSLEHIECLVSSNARGLHLIGNLYNA